ncbi:MAG: hypothetical protein AAF462_06790 [Thermodesulfobacteriota bacterium]
MTRVFKYVGIFLFLISIGCAGQQGGEEEGGFDASICNNIPVGIETAVAADPESKAFKISCADLAQCTSIMGWDAPPDVPCTGP